MRNKKWLRLLAYVTGSVNQELLLQNEYLAAENRISEGEAAIEIAVE
jgi:putative transposase